MKTGWVTMTAAVAAMLGLLAAGASAKDAPKGPGGDEKPMVIQIDGKTYKLVPVAQDKPAKATEGRVEEKGPKAEAKKDKDGEEKDAKAKGEKDKDEPRGKDAEARKGKHEGGKGEKDAKAVGPGPLAGKKVILRIDGKDYVAVIVGELPGKPQADKKNKGEGEKAAQKDKEGEEKGARKGGEKDKKPKGKAHDDKEDDD